MPKPLATAGALLCTVAALLAFFILDQTLLALLFAMLAVLLSWAGTSILGNPPRTDVRDREIDPREVKDYREQHPGTSIGEAIDALYSDGGSR